MKEVRSSSATTWYALSQGVALPPVLSLMRPAARKYAWRMRFSHEHELRVEVTNGMGGVEVVPPASPREAADGAEDGAHDGARESEGASVVVFIADFIAG